MFCMRIQSLPLATLLGDHPRPLSGAYRFSLQELRIHGVRFAVVAGRENPENERLGEVDSCPPTRVALLTHIRSAEARPELRQHPPVPQSTRPLTNVILHAVVGHLIGAIVRKLLAADTTSARKHLVAQPGADPAEISQSPMNAGSHRTPSQTMAEQPLDRIPSKRLI